MKKLLLTLFLLPSALLAFAQSSQPIAYPDGKFYLYRLSLTDKKGSEHSVRHPERFLSEKALQRRAKQGLQVDSTDLPISRKYLKQIAERNVEIVGGSKWNNTVLIKVRKPEDALALQDFPFVSKAIKVFTAPDSTYKSHPDNIKPDTAAAKTSETSIYGKGLGQIEMLNGIKLHEAGFRGEGMLIAIVDGGYMNVDKISYFRNVDIIGWRDFVYPYDSNIYHELDHGTMVLSCIAANADSLFIGTAPHASFLLLRSEDGRTENLVEEDYWAQAVEYADSAGADIINSSLGYSRFDDKEASHQYFEQDGKTALISRTASMLAGKGMILVNSGGNEGRGTWKRIGFPADACDVLTVAALSRDSLNAPFSSVGPSYDGRIKPDVAAQGVAVTVISGAGIITKANGTSFAAPITCGMVACLWQALPDKTAHELMELVRGAGNHAEHPDNIFGYGIPDFWKAYQQGKVGKQKDDRQQNGKAHAKPL